METLAPSLLIAVQEVRWRICSGHSMKDSFRMYLETTSDALAEDFRLRWTLKWQSKNLPKQNGPAFRNLYRAAFWDLVERGCAGQPIAEPLAALEQEIERAAQEELDLHLATVPFKVLIPLLFLQFPAYLLVLLGPLWREMHSQLGG